MGISDSINAGVRERLVARMRALMARTVVNGCTDEEELVAARMVGKLVAQVDAMDGTVVVEDAPQQHWAKAERDSREYQQLLEKNTTESVLKAAVRELALNHINTVSPPRRRDPREPVDRVGIHELLDAHLGMVLGNNSSRLSREILGRMIDELVYDGALPQFLDIPLSRR